MYLAMVAVDILCSVVYMHYSEGSFHSYHCDRGVL